MQLRPYQEQAVKVSVDYFNGPSVKPSLIVAPTAYGKSVVIGSVANQLQGKTIILQPSKELLEQNFNKLMMLGGMASIYSASAGEKEFGNITYATIGSIKNIGRIFKDYGYTNVIVDECFPAGTMIDGLRIEQIKPGDLVKSYNHEMNKLELKRVVRLFKKQNSSDLIRFVLKNGLSFICTDNHPIFTIERGYVAAKEVYLYPDTYTLLYDRESLRDMQGRFYSSSKELSEALLFKGVQKSRFRCDGGKQACYVREERAGAEKSSHYSFAGGRVQCLQEKTCNHRRQAKGVQKNRGGLLRQKLFSLFSIWKDRKAEKFGKNEKEQSHVDAGREGKNDSSQQGADISIKGREWAAYKASNDAASCNRISDGIRNRNGSGKRLVSFCTELLQGGFSNPRKENCNRSGRGFSQAKEVEVFRQKEDRNIERIGVESASIYQFGSGKEHESLCEENIVYNIEVEDNHNYFANGVLVHNCHLYPPSSDSMFSKFMDDLGVKKVLGFTATPFRLQTYTSQSGFRYSQLNMLTGRSKSAGFFKEILHVHQISEMVKEGYWSPLTYQSFDIDSGALQMNSTGAEFTDSSVQVMYEAEGINQRIARVCREIDSKSILIFVPTVKNAMELQTMIPSSVVVYGDMDKHMRAYAIKGFRSGQYRVAINVNVLSVGFDYPGIDCIMLARPTASLAWYYQAIGRGTRILEGKKFCRVIDFVGNVERFGAIEGLTVENDSGKWDIWSGDVLLTSIPVNEIGSVMRGEKSGYLMPFGKYKGKKISEVPISYLTWMKKEVTWSDRNVELKDQINARLKGIKDAMGVKKINCR